MKNVLPFLDRMVSTVFWIGYSPWAPGTMGSLAALAFWLILPTETASREVLGISVVSVLGILSSGRFSARLGIVDPGIIVVDEFVGQFISLLWTEHDIIHGLTAFLFFRILDIFKLGSRLRHVQTRRFARGTGVRQEQSGRLRMSTHRPKGLQAYHQP